MVSEREKMAAVAGQAVANTKSRNGGAVANEPPPPAPPESGAPRRSPAPASAQQGTATSRARTVRAAVRKPSKARLALSGPSGSGKTWSALSIAHVLAPGGSIVMIDTEPSDDLNSASELYADVFAFDVIDWRSPPFDPRDLTATIVELGSMGQTDVLIVDSGSPFWRGEGGTLDIVDGRFGGWKTGTPAQDALVRAILNSPMHIIFCTRAKQSYEVTEGENKRQTVTKLGLAPIQRDDLEYEFQVVCMIDTEHRIDIGKTRAQPLAGKSFLPNGEREFAEIYKAWLDKGPRLIRQFDADLIVAAFGRLPVDDQPAAKRQFGTEIGRPASLEVEQMPGAWAWLSAHTGVDPHPFAPQSAEPTMCGVCDLGRRAGWHAGADAAPVARRTHDATTTGQADGPGSDDATAGTEARTDESVASDGTATGGDEPPDAVTAGDGPGDGDPPAAVDVGETATVELPVDPHAAELVDRPGSAEADDAAIVHRQTVDPEPADPTIVATITARVLTMKHADVIRDLTNANRPVSGQPRAVKQRLIDLLVEREMINRASAAAAATTVDA